MKLPNGYGGVVKLNGNRRNPYMIRKTIGYKPNGTPLYKILGYYPTKTDALIALANFNQQKSTPKPVTTFANVYNRWLDMHRQMVVSTTIKNYKSAYNHLTDIVTKPIDTISYNDVLSVFVKMDLLELSYSTKKKVRTLLNQVFKHALNLDLIDKSPSDHIVIGKNKPVRPHKPFTRQKINRLWKSDHTYAHIPLILLYTGMRSIELRNLKSSDINLKQRYIRITKSKTKSGIRIIPIHHRLLPIIKKHIGKRYLLSDTPITYNKLSKQFKSVMRSINATHTTHDCRHTFATLLDTVGANQHARRKLLGHAGGDVTDRVYTHKNLRELRKAINLLQ